MVNFVVVIEGGGSGPSLKAKMAKGFQNLFSNINPSMRKPRIIRGGGRTQALDKFNTAWKSRRKGDMVLLLIDSEEPIVFGTSKIAHLGARDQWKNKPADVQEDDVFLMVCVMESWICADSDALKQFYNGGFDESKLPSVNKLESVQRGVLYDSLERATQECKKKPPYSKGRHSFELIGMVSPSKLARLPHANQFIEALKMKVDPKP